jgi:hypothetical protein
MQVRRVFLFFWLEPNVGHHHNIPVPSGTGPWFARHSPTSDGAPDMRGANSRNTVPYTVLAFKLHSCVKCVDDLGDKRESGDSPNPHPHGCAALTPAMHLIPWDVSTVHSGPFESTGMPMPLNRSIATISDRLSLGTMGLFPTDQYVPY